MMPFHTTFISLITGQFGVIRVGTTNWIWAAAGIALSLYQGYAKGQAAKKAGGASRDVSYANASDLREFSGINADLLLGAAGRNAEAQLVIGEANASAVERATSRNLMLYGMQAEEEGRRHVYGERMSAGRIRSMVGASGVQTNTGTPLMFLYSQVDEGIRQRKFMLARHEQTMWTMAEEGKDKAGIMRLTASENAAVIMSNAEAQAEVSILDAERQASAMERGGDLAASTGSAAATAAYIGGITSAIGGLASSGMFSPTTAAIGGTGSTTFASNWQQAGGWNSTVGWMNPSASYSSSGSSMFGNLQTGFTSSWGR